MPGTSFDRAEEVAALLRRHRMGQATERVLQKAIAQVLTDAGIPFAREVSLGPGARPDFMVEPRLALEVKIKGPVAQVRRQLERYAESPKVDAILLVTTRHDHVFDPDVEGKPLLVLCVGSAFL